MARRSRPGGKGPLWHGYRRPVWRDKVFWLAFGTSIAGLLVQNAFGNFEATGRGWAILGLEVVITFAISFALIGVLAGTFRGFGEGWRQAEQAATPPTPDVPPGPGAPSVDAGVEVVSASSTVEPATEDSTSAETATEEPTVSQHLPQQSTAVPHLSEALPAEAGA